MVEFIEYKSAAKPVTINGIMEISDRNGIKWYEKDEENIAIRVYSIWTAQISYNNQNGTYRTNFSWIFDWSQLKAQGCDQLTGNITVRSSTGIFNAFSVNVDLKNTVQTITDERSLNYSSFSATYEYSLTPQYTPIQKVTYDEMFLPSELTDAILVVDGKKLHVNKMFLSFHSEFFRALFSSNYKEGSMAEIPIIDVSYEDFGLLLSTIYPKTVFPNDETVEKLLEMADRFLMLSVIGNVEYHLLHNTRIGNEKLMWMADAYRMDKLLEKTVRETSTVEKAKLSKDPKTIVLDHILLYSIISILLISFVIVVDCFVELKFKTL